MLEHSNSTDMSSHDSVKTIYIWPRCKDFSAKIYQLNVNFFLYSINTPDWNSRMHNVKYTRGMKILIRRFINFKEVSIRNPRNFYLKTLVK